MSLVRLRRSAARVRREFERGTFDLRLAIAAYTAYAPEVGDVPGFVERARGLFPTGCCGLCSVYLRSRLGCGTVVSGSYDGHLHTVLLVDGLLVDVTADQFGGPPIYVGPPRPPWGSAHGPEARGEVREARAQEHDVHEARERRRACGPELPEQYDGVQDDQHEQQRPFAQRILPTACAEEPIISGRRR
jgi:hypothetical protein